MCLGQGLPFRIVVTLWLIAMQELEQTAVFMSGPILERKLVLWMKFQLSGIIVISGQVQNCMAR
ncbi:hypothetical protein VI06_17390 [Aquitalea magnusonii]|nr:hypothetical protein VI06_17390 [Aquitalea magnusonii]